MGFEGVVMGNKTELEKWIFVAQVLGVIAWASVVTALGFVLYYYISKYW